LNKDLGNNIDMHILQMLLYGQFLPCNQAMIHVSNINLERPWPCRGLWNLKAIRRIFFFYFMREFLLWKFWCLGCSWWDQQGTNKGPSYYLWLTFISKDWKRKMERQSMNTMSHDNIIQCHTRTFDAFCQKESRRIERMQDFVEEEEDAMRTIPLGEDFHYHY
jgi:hypothetical protein